MYQKRLRGYAELGYQAKANTNSGQPGIIFDSRSFYAPFAADITAAGRDIVIISPFMRKARITSILKLLAGPLSSGVRVAVITRPPEDYAPE